MWVFRLSLQTFNRKNEKEGKNGWHSTDGAAQGNRRQKTPGVGFVLQEMAKAT